MHEFSSKKVVVVRFWGPTYKGIPVTYWQAWLRRMFTPSDHEARMGHLSVSIEDGNREQDASVFPVDIHIFNTSKTTIYNLHQDLDAQGNHLPNIQVTLFSLDTEKMLARYDKLSARVRWYLTGGWVIGNFSKAEIHNCASFVEDLLAAGGLYDILLPKSAKPWGIMSPRNICALAARAAQAEAQRFPEREEVMKEYIGRFTNGLVQQSLDEDDPLSAISQFIETYPDFYMRAVDYNPAILKVTLATVYQNIQTFLNKNLLQVAQQCQPGLSSEDEAFFITTLDKLLVNGANLSHKNQDGQNALDVLTQNNCDAGVRTILHHIPQAGSTVTLLGLALVKGEHEICDLAKHMRDQHTPLEQIPSTNNLAFLMFTQKERKESFVSKVAHCIRSLCS